LAEADAFVINGGYSAVSEALALRKPVFVVPVPGHAEQSDNSSLIRDLGLGFVATEGDVLDQLLKMYHQNEWFGLQPIRQPFELTGTQQAADAIVRVANAPPRPRSLAALGHPAAALDHG
jgi:UDP:flavonoid glycosyltransferase YjiC (YdhE family)